MKQNSNCRCPLEAAQSNLLNIIWAYAYALIRPAGRAATARRESAVAGAASAPGAMRWTCRMNGAEVILRTLANNGVEVCFSNPGTSEMQLVAAFDHESRVRPVLCLFEGVATG